MSHCLTYSIMQQFRKERGVLIDSLKGAFAAYSLRKISLGDRFCLKVRRSSDNSELVIGFKDGVIDVSLLENFCSGCDGYVSIWYDQSGNLNHAYNNEASNQPQIVSSGVIVKNSQNNLPALTFNTDATDCLLMTKTSSTVRSVFLVVNPYNPDSSKITFLLGDSSQYHFSAPVGYTSYFDHFASTYVKGGALYLYGGLISYTKPKQNFIHLLSLFTTGNVNVNQISRDRSLARSYGGIGVVQEILIYNSDQSANRVAIEGNIANFYKFYKTPTLNSTYSGALAAYSFRNLGTSDDEGYYCLMVRRSSDNALKNIGFSSGVLDETTLTDFCGTGDGFVVIWYDQSGNNKHAYQTTDSLQPQIVTSGTVITNNGKPALTYKSGGGDNLMIYDRMTTIRSVFWVINPYSGTTTGYNGFILGDSATHDFCAPATANSKYFDSTYANTYVKNGSLYRNGSAITTTATARTNAQQLLSLFTTGNVNSNQITKDRTLTGRSLDAAGALQEIIIFDSDKSADRSTIESDINSFYSIY